MRKLLALVAMLVLTGCATGRSGTEAMAYWRGLLRSVGDSYLFQPCGETEWRALGAIPPLLQQEYERQRAGAPGIPIYIEGWSERFGTQWMLTEPRVIGGGLAACEQFYPGVDLHVVGHQPGWQVDLNGAELRYSNVGALQTLVFGSSRFMREGSIWRWLAKLADKRGRTFELTLEVTDTPCRDALGIWYNLSASADLDGTLYTGCARYGGLERFSLARRYQTEPGRYMRQLALTLALDGQARLTDDYLNGQPLIVSDGRWQLMSDGRMLLTLSAAQGQGDIPLLWSRHGDTLRLETADPVYGKGLELSADSELEWAADYRRRLP